MGDLGVIRILASDLISLSAFEHKLDMTQAGGVMADTFWRRSVPPSQPFATKAARPSTSGLSPTMAHIPVLVVGRPSAREGRCHVMTSRWTSPCWGAGWDDDAQAELDAYADELWTVLGGTRGVKVGDTHLACRGVVPATVAVAGLEYPAYLHTVTTDALSC